MHSETGKGLAKSETENGLANQLQEDFIPQCQNWEFLRNND